MNPSPTFYTISDARFFPGTVALLNSLRLTGNEGPLVVLDAGLEPHQRARLEDHATVVAISDLSLANPGVNKAFLRFLEPSGVIAIIDSDMIVTRPLQDAVQAAASGKICVFPDPNRDRRFEEWQQIFDLRGSLRRQTYVNAGFIALDVEHWADFLERYWVLCQTISDRPLDQMTLAKNPLGAGDQDVLNALLMSEIAEEAVALLPAAAEAHEDELLAVKVVDPRSLRCVVDSTEVAILHYSWSPKAWEARAWTRVRRDAYLRLVPRVLFGADVAMRIYPREVPSWIRPGPFGRGVLTSLDVAHRAVTKLLDWAA